MWYIETPHNYCVYFPSLRMTVVHRDVKFDEEKSLRFSFESKLQLHLDQNILALKEVPQEVVEKSQAKEQRLETPTQAETSREGRKKSREVERIFHDARENLGAPTSHRRQRRSSSQHTGYMALMGELVEAQSSSFEEVDAMVDEYDSIIKKSVLEVVPNQKKNHWWV